MAGTEMKHIRDLDHEAFEEISHKTLLYYGQTDRWAPIDHYHDMKENFPKGKKKGKKERHKRNKIIQ